MRASLTALVTVCLVATVACDSGDDDAAGDGAAEPAQTVATAPPSPFCEAIDRLATRLDESSTDDDRRIIVEAYTEMLELVPADMRPEFESVLDSLRAAPRATTATTDVIATIDLDAPETSQDTTSTDDGASDASTTSAPPPVSGVPAETPPGGTLDFEEGYTPSDDPAARINAYVEFACDRSDNNPGPAPTQPATPPPGTAE